MSKMGLYKKLGTLVSTLLMGASLGGNFHSFAMLENEGIQQEAEVESFETTFPRLSEISAEKLYSNGCDGIIYDGKYQSKGVFNDAPANATLCLLENDRLVAYLTVTGQFSDFCNDKHFGDNMVALKVKELNEGLKALKNQEPNNVVEKNEKDIQELNNELQALPKKEKEIENHNVDNPVEVRFNKAGLQKQVNVLGNQDGSNISNYLPKVGAGTLIPAAMLCYWWLR